MTLQIIISLVTFAGVFLLVRLFFPATQARLEGWQKARIDRITPKLDRMFLVVPLKRLMLLDVLSPLLCGLLGFLFTRTLWVAFAAMAGGLFVPMVILRQLESARRKKFTSQLVDALMILSSSLKAGLSLTQAFETLVEEMPAPIAQEFGLVVRQMRMGISIEEAMHKLKKRMAVDELDMVITAMMVSKETGGDLITTFSKVTHTIQERNKLVGRVNTLCVQAKMQGVIMSILPILFGLFVYKVNPGFFDIFLKDRFGRLLLVYAAISEVLGIIFIAKLSRVDV
ncbi:MAG: type II secretion system F family protein [Candidatus Omnitrophica bacterium]|nr:type II secretion system F family protein [Candidatus Omnitrophota bacterium]